MITAAPKPTPISVTMASFKQSEQTIATNVVIQSRRRGKQRFGSHYCAFKQLSSVVEVGQALTVEMVLRGPAGHESKCIQSALSLRACHQVLIRTRNIVFDCACASALVSAPCGWREEMRERWEIMRRTVLISGGEEHQARIALNNEKKRGKHTR